MTRHLVKLLEMLWITSMGLFLGLHAGTILAVVETFDSSRKVNATPGQTPYADPRFAENANEVVAGFMAQNMFKNAGVVALILLGVAIVSRYVHPFFVAMAGNVWVGNKKLSHVRFLAVTTCTLLMLAGANNMMQMNREWPGLYEVDADQEVLDARRDKFDAAHKTSERLVGTAWFAGALALVISPWCRRIADDPIQAGSESKE
jgi:hypothetical protein